MLVNVCVMCIDRAVQYALVMNISVYRCSTEHVYTLSVQRLLAFNRMLTVGGKTAMVNVGILSPYAKQVSHSTAHMHA